MKVIFFCSYIMLSMYCMYRNIYICVSHMDMIMLWFGKQNAITIKDYEDVCKRLSKCEAKIEGLIIENEDLRNKVLRKLQLKRMAIETEETEQKEPETNYLPAWIRK